jgi:hypothetical protein
MDRVGETKTKTKSVVSMGYTSAAGLDILEESEQRGL